MYVRFFAVFEVWRHDTYVLQISPRANFFGHTGVGAASTRLTRTTRGRRASERPSRQKHALQNEAGLGGRLESFVNYVSFAERFGSHGPPSHTSMDMLRTTADTKDAARNPEDCRPCVCLWMAARGRSCLLGVRCHFTTTFAGRHKHASSPAQRPLGQRADLRPD